MTKNARQRGKVGERGFTLVEMIVAVALFSVVMLVSVGTLLALVGANRKAQALQSVMSNLNIALDSMVRSIRMGSVYHCGGGNYTVPADCANGGTTFAFKPFGVSSAPTVYRFNGTRIERSENGGSFIGITAPEVSIDITSSRFYDPRCCGCRERPAKSGHRT